MLHEAIDVFCHVLPPKLSQAVSAALAKPSIMFERARRIRVMVDLDQRLRLMDGFAGYRQIISLAGPPLEVLAPTETVTLATIANKEMAQWVETSDGRICGFAAALPLNWTLTCTSPIASLPLVTALI